MRVPKNTKLTNTYERLDKHLKPFAGLRLSSCKVLPKY